MAHVHRGQVLRTAAISKESNVLWLDEGAVEGRLESLPWVADSVVRTTLTLTVEISITERSPVAVATDGIDDVLMAEDGTALGPPSDARGLPRIELAASGSLEGAAPSPVGAARALGAIPPGIRDRIARVTVLLDGTLEMRVRGGPLIRFGSPGDAVRKARAISRVLAWSRREGVGLLLLSVVSPNAPAVRIAG